MKEKSEKQDNPPRYIISTQDGRHLADRMEIGERGVEYWVDGKGPLSGRTYFIPWARIILIEDFGTGRIK